MKRTVVFFLTALISLTLTACGQSTPPSQSATAANTSATSVTSAAGTPEPTSPQPSAEAAGSAQSGDTGIVGSWKIKAAEMGGTIYTADELLELTSELGELGLVFTMQLAFSHDGTGEMTFDGLDLGDTDMNLTWEGYSSSGFSMIDSEGSATEITYNAADDTLAIESGVSLMTFERK